MDKTRDAHDQSGSAEACSIDLAAAWGAFLQADGPRRELPTTRQVADVLAPRSTDDAASPYVQELNDSWQRGERVSAATLLQRHPELAGQRDSVLRLVCEEICLHREAGLVYDPAALLLQLPQWRHDIEGLLLCQQLLEDDLPQQPKPLGALLDFQLLAELGKGGAGQVYLATQPQLADRPVVVKVTPCRGQEHLSLARLQHTSIVPLYWVHDRPDEDQRVLCMPYFGEVTLAKMLSVLQGIPVAERNGRHILEVLDAHRSEAVPSLEARGPARQLLARADYAQAIAWMGACLAEALAYAHARDLLHLDIKPSNILWTTDGQPMLLDFHLARAPFKPGDPKPRGLGGTPVFMAPEQEAALNAVCQNQPIPCAVDGRADVYALGLVMYQALGGPVPITGDTPSLDDLNPQVTPGLADIITRCLARDAADRYPSAESLASDLRRHLGDAPLRGVSNRSWRERWNKWRRRRPNELAALVASVVVVAIVTAGSLFWWHDRQTHLARETQFRDEARDRIVRAERTLPKAQQYALAGRYDLAHAALESGRALLPDVVEAEPARAAFERESRRLQTLQARQSLHEGVNLLRLAVVADEISAVQLKQLQAKCQLLWELRQVLFDEGRAADERLRQDLIDLAVIWSDLRGRDGLKADERRALLRVLEETGRDCGPSVLLDQARAEHLASLGEDAAARTLRPPADAARTAAPWEQIAQARRLLQRMHLDQQPLLTGHALQAVGAAPSQSAVAALLPLDRVALDAAATYLRSALAATPDNFWANYYQGVCAYRLRDAPEAVAAFRACIVLAPRNASVWHNRGLAQAQQKNWREAIADYTQALHLDPRFTAAALNRAVARAESGDKRGALADLEMARRLGASPALVEANIAVVSRMR